MERIICLISIEQDDTLTTTSLEAIGLTRHLSEQLKTPEWYIGVVGTPKSIELVNDCLTGLGASKIFVALHEEFSKPRYSTDAAAAEVICKAASPDIVIAPSTARWSRIIPGVAFRLNGTADTHVTAINVQNNTPLINRWIYRQRIELQLSRQVRPWFLTVEPAIFEPASKSKGSSPVEKIEVPVSTDLLNTEVIGFQTPKSSTQTIRPDAKLLFVAGAGWTKKQADGLVHAEEAQKLILEFLELTQSSLGGTKSVVDLSNEGNPVLPFMTHLNQVGQTGATPRHPKGLATCCHGEEPHVVGWRFINERRAVNLDPNCGWAQGKADVLYVADAFAVLRELNKKLSGSKK
jgi:electron transfer flavoprotein alpha subunit